MALMVTKPSMDGSMSALMDASRVRAKSRSFAGTSLTTTVYVSRAALGTGGGTNEVRRTGAGILDTSACTCSARCPRDNPRGAGA